MTNHATHVEKEQHEPKHHSNASKSPHRTHASISSLPDSVKEPRYNMRSHIRAAGYTSSTFGDRLQSIYNRAQALKDECRQIQSDFGTTEAVEFSFSLFLWYVPENLSPAETKEEMRKSEIGPLKVLQLRSRESTHVAQAGVETGKGGMQQQDERMEDVVASTATTTTTVGNDSVPDNNNTSTTTNNLAVVPTHQHETPHNAPPPTAPKGPKGWRDLVNPAQSSVATGDTRPVPSRPLSERINRGGGGVGGGDGGSGGISKKKKKKRARGKRGQAAAQATAAKELTGT